MDERSAEQSPRLAAVPSRLRQPNARLESTGLRPATQARTRLGNATKTMQRISAMSHEGQVYSRSIWTRDRNEVPRNKLSGNLQVERRIISVGVLKPPDSRRSVRIGLRKRINSESLVLFFQTFAWVKNRGGA